MRGLDRLSEKYELCVSSEIKNLSLISDFVTSVAKELQLDDAVTFALQMAVDEASANVMEHAYGGRTDGVLNVACQRKGHTMVITIRDHGCAFDPASVPRPDPFAPLERRGEGALGLYLMEQLMDSVRFHFDPEVGNTLIMEKRIYGGEQAD
jgi:anti-sigma regulatory factor (Ser/Thr protein kinase)